ncbi:MAG TPA: hybrid sensor histidine kinase/response regulator, partial [Abditibacteriaceae bacterium]|jgi:signal transduction histidine kinase
MGHRVTTANNGREALELLRRDRFDLVLMDVQMPEMDGFTTLDILKSDELLRDIPVVMVSGVDDLDTVVRCIERGAEDYLPKQFNPTILRARVGACLEKKGLWDELRRNYNQLQELEVLRDSLTHMIVHDLRTPLTSLLTGLQTVPRLGDLNEDQLEFMNISIDGGQTLLSMINDLLDISKMEAGLMKLALQETIPEVLIGRALRQVTSLAAAKHLDVSAQVAPNLPLLLLDEDKMLRTLVNLLGNAIKFTPEGGSIHASVHQEADETTPDAGGKVRFSVQDTGEGIPEESFGRIFEKFGQVEGARSGHKMSTGLGLTFCKMVIEAHGGHIGIASRLGEGSTFSLVVPVH